MNVYIFEGQMCDVLHGLFTVVLVLQLDLEVPERERERGGGYLLHSSSHYCSTYHSCLLYFLARAMAWE